MDSSGPETENDRAPIYPKPETQTSKNETQFYDVVRYTFRCSLPYQTFPGPLEHKYDYRAIKSLVKSVRLTFRLQAQWAGSANTELHESASPQFARCYLFCSAEVARNIAVPVNKTNGWRLKPGRGEYLETRQISDNNKSLQ
jgi:hypothetical protein